MNSELQRIWKWLCHNLRYYPGIGVEGLKNTLFLLVVN